MNLEQEKYPPIPPNSKWFVQGPSVDYLIPLVWYFRYPDSAIKTTGFRGICIDDDLTPEIIKRWRFIIGSVAAEEWLEERNKLWSEYNKQNRIDQASDDSMQQYKYILYCNNVIYAWRKWAKE